MVAEEKAIPQGVRGGIAEELGFKQILNKEKKWRRDKDILGSGNSMYKSI